MTSSDATVETSATRLLKELRELIEAARHRVASSINIAQTLLYWHIGRCIRLEILHEERAPYGQKIVHALSAQLQREYGRGFTPRNLFNMMRLAEVYPDEEVVRALSATLTWTHLRTVVYLEDPLKRDFYAEMCRVEGWSTRTLKAKIDGMLYERTAVSRQPETLVQQELAALREEDRLSPDLVFRDPCVLDFLGLSDVYSERDLEAAILRELERFILELGAGFAFIARQFRITIDNDDYYLDLLFYHRRLRRLIAIDLKLGKFRAADKGQMELYLRWLDRHQRLPEEQAPLGLILCADKSDEHVELLELEASGIRVAQYLTELPPRDVLRQKLHDAITAARGRLLADGEA
jgi:predicted nuclease of restriction endonuclease-like (RecB) superfamily